MTRRPISSHISARQLLILRDIAEGMTTAAIAKKQFVSEFTVKNDIRTVKEVLGAKNNAHAVALAYQMELLVPGAEPKLISREASLALLAQHLGYSIHKWEDLTTTG